MDFAKQIEYNRRLLVEDIFRRLEAALQPLVDAVNDFFAVLFSRRLPVDWREQWHALIAEQEAAGYRISPQSVREYEDWIEAWARYCELLPVAETRVVSPAPAAAEQPPISRRTSPKPVETNRREQFFNQKLADAQGSLDEIKRLLDEFGGRLDVAKLDETVDAEAEVERCEALIWRYHDALESARNAWLRDDLSGEADARMAKLLSPSHFGLPRITDEQQDQRAMRQLMQMNARSHGRDKTMDRVVFGMEAVEWVGYGAGIAAGGGVLYTAAKKGGKWGVVKALAVIAAGAAAEQGVEAGLRAAGASEETIRGARLAAAVIAFILIRRKSGMATPAMSVPRPTLANATKGWKVGDPINNLTAKGNQPVWSTVRRRFWKNEALTNPSKYDEASLNRMKRGLAPQRPNPKTGQMESVELHHAPPQRDGGLFDVKSYWPDEHSKIDPFRSIGE